MRGASCFQKGLSITSRLDKFVLRRLINPFCWEP